MIETDREDIAMEKRINVMDIGLTMNDTTDKPWWNRPLVGDKAITDYLFKQYSRVNICPEIIYIHDQSLEKLEHLTITLRALFNAQFSDSDFLIFARLEGYFYRYCQGKKHYFLVARNLFKVIFDNFETLEKVIKTEKNHTEEIYTNFYLAVLNLIYEGHHKLVFQEKLRKLNKNYNKSIDDKNQRKILNTYTRNFLTLSEEDDFLHFFHLLKINNLIDVSFFKKVKEFVDHNNHDNISDLNTFLLFAKSDEDLWVKVATKIVKFKEDDQELILMNIAKILQYVTLVDKYESLYSQFQLFLKYLSKWEKLYYNIVSIRRKYSMDTYIIPASFRNKLMGFDLYKAYYDYLDYSYLNKLIF